MKLPSIEQVALNARLTFVRFPVVLIVAIIGTCASVVMLDMGHTHTYWFLNKVLLPALLGIPLLIALALTAEKEHMSRTASAALQGGGLVLLAVYGISLPTALSAGPEIHTFRLFVLLFAAHMLVACLPFLRKGEANGFWNYNISLLQRVPVALLYTLVLYAGLAIALAAVDNLFGLHLPGKRYGELFITLSGIFTTWFFLTGIPKDLHALDEVTTYPKGLKIFAQYILLPLALIYLVILYAYAGKILIEWDWPRGWVSKLVLGFAGTGAFVLLLLYPLRFAEGSTWVQRASRWFHIVLIPLVVMLFFAVFRRISQYGWTEGRYIAVVLGAWCVFLILYFLFSHGKGLKLIPLTLCVLAIVCSYGPWSMFTIARNSQTARLESILARNGMLKEGKVVKPAKPVSDDDAREISGTLEYLHTFQGYGTIEQWFPGSLAADPYTERTDRKSPGAVARMLDVEYVEGWVNAENEVFSIETADNSPLSIAGYDLLLPQRVFSRQWKREYGSDVISIRANSDLSTLTVRAKLESGASDSVTFDIRALYTRLIAAYGKKNIHAVPIDAMCIAAQSTHLSVKVYPNLFEIVREDGRTNLNSYRFQVMYRITP